MFWMYCSAQIVLSGAELTKAIADERAPVDRRTKNEKPNAVRAFWSLQIAASETNPRALHWSVGQSIEAR
jgi:hypothetical protein